MPGRAKSATLKARIARTTEDDIMSRAVAAYQRKLAKKPGEPRRSMRKICKDFEELYFNETGKVITLSHATLGRLAAGGQTLQEFNSSKSHLIAGEANTIIDFIIETGNCGFPLSHRRLKNHVDQILQACLGPSFPGVGRNWTQRFAEKYSSQIKVSWGTSLEEKRGQGANPHSNEAWWKLLGDTLKKYDIKPENIYGVDEVGIQPQGGERERVFGGRKKGMQYQQRGGTRENITVLVTICADGTSQAPAVIFKGSAYQVKWIQNNPLNASIGYQKKGWTDGEIGAEWMKIFDKETSAKAGNEYCLLVVDGHNSHFTLLFLQHARANKIIVLCYPAHTTHIYQGLDVVIFAVLKLALSSKRDKWLRENGKVIDKTNFLEIYGKAHIRALTKDNILAAFRKTGIVPFNPAVITDDMLAPAKESLQQGHLPLPPPTPVRAVARLLEKLSINDPVLDEESEDVLEGSPSSILNLSRTAFDDALKSLSQSSLAYLLSNKQPVLSSDPMHRTPSQPILPSNDNHGILSTLVPQTKNEILLMASLREAQESIKTLRRRVVDLQASNILNELYCNKLRFQLAYKEEKKAKDSERGKLVGDGLPKMLTSNEFYERVVEFTKWQNEKEVEKEARKMAGEAYQEQLTAWKKTEDERKIKNKKIKDDYHTAVALWEKQKEEAKTAGKARQFKEKKPLRGPLLKAIPKPKRQKAAEDNEDSGEEVFGDVSGSNDGEETDD